MQSTSDKLARIISTLFVPPSFTIIVFTLFALTLESEPTKQLVTILAAFIFGFSAQIVLFLYFRKHKKIADLDASIKEERTIPLFISVAFYLIGFFILLYFNVSIVSIALWFCYISNTFVAIFINKYWKISAHSMGSAGPLAAVTYVFGPTALIFLLLVILIGWSRVKLMVHNFLQVATGILLAFTSTYFQIYFIVDWIR